MLTNLKNTALVAVFGLGLSACASDYFDAKKATPQGGDYSQALYTEMMKIADFEAGEEDWADASYHGGRALAAANGEAHLQKGRVLDHDHDRAVLMLRR